MNREKGLALEPWKHEFGEGYIQGYRSQIDENKPTLHFLHGNGFAVQTYRRFLLKLDGYNLLMQDAAGHGMSPSGKQFVGWNGTEKRFSNSLKSQKERLKSSELIGIGHSFGGVMTTLMSERDPKLFSRLVLLDPALFPPRLLWMMHAAKLLGVAYHTPLAKQALRRRTQWDSFAQVKNNFYERGTFKGWEEACLDDYITYATKQDSKGHYQLGCPAWMEAAIFASAPKGVWRAIRRISVPTFIIQGKDTYKHFKEAYQLAAHLNPNIRVVEAEGGHCFMLQDTEKAARLVLDVLDESKG
ncbi:alpha/beta fold hydrolase [Marinomonas transparens]|uniref:Alpha/beta hydrolase n=1 Tax=Marinomonas transparens TaxID=2795388 RepID=A0A934JRW2_9GAMM|nr:alpha/beta hydrolase [Marinomonas transparens]MBJ7539563.1 alpha/beta hydrolase [Marinomonas transparens]